MDEILAVALQAMQHDMARLDRVGMNLANAQTPGYKRDVMVVRPFGQLVDSLAVANAAQPAPVNEAVLLRTDNRPGTLKSTGQGLDVALAGPGYFEVVTPNGPAYTRQGNFRLDAQGRLVTAQGYPVMGKGGEIFLKNPAPSIDVSGQVYDSPAQGSVQGQAPSRMAGTMPVAQLRVVNFASSESVQRIGDGLITADSAPDSVNEKDVQVRQGFVENSNVNPMHEMVHMIQAMRHFESMQKVAIGHDDMLATAIRKLGDQN